MRKIFILMFLAIITFGLTACGEEATEKEVESVGASGKEDKEEEADAEDATSEKEEVGEVIADDDHIKATLVSVEHIEDETFDEELYEVNIELENKTDETLEVQANEVSIDGTMVDDLVFFSETVAGGKSSNGVLTIQNYDGDLPTMDNDIEFILSILNEETFETIADHDVNVEF